MLGVRLGVVGILAREDVKVLTVYVDLSVICVAALAWRFGPTIVVVLFGVLRFVLAMVGVIARVVIKVKIDITNGFGIWLF
ncbi:hypothetical protein BTURTLESOX_1855 [bacterium endosymbiont of Bathymodiolus sp. 5 South]|nr:hypothetical protein BTURTLESOX_1855 [bacterium endosymbiont of Bathymodiolus sp. 5 South]